MKFVVEIKSPDCFFDAFYRAGIVDSHGFVVNERAYNQVDKFVDFMEYVTIEFDTDKGTAKVVNKNEG